MVKYTQTNEAPLNRRAITLVEVIVSCMIVAVMLIAAMKSVGAVYRTRLIAAEQGQGHLLAHAMMAEILQLNYEDPVASAVKFGRETGESSTVRTSWNDVDDYHNWTASPPKAKDGTPIPDFNGWTRAVTIHRAVRISPVTDWFFETGLKRIEVTVTSPSGVVFEIKALRSKLGAMETIPPIDRTYVAGVSADLQMGSGRVTIGEAPVVNHALD